MFREMLARVKSFFLPQGSRLDPSERRQMVRVRCHIPVQCRPAETTRSGWILDMGLQGMRVRFSSPLKVGSIVPVRATMPGHARPTWVKFQVRWVRALKHNKGYSHGICYAQSADEVKGSWVSVLLRELGLDDRRLHERREYIRAEGRLPVSLEWIAAEQGRAPVPAVEMVNLAVGGVLLRSRLPLYVGQKVRVRLGPAQALPALELDAEVLSDKSDDGAISRLAGLRFTDLQPAQVRVLGQYVLSLLEGKDGS